MKNILSSACLAALFVALASCGKSPTAAVTYDPLPADLFLAASPGTPQNVVDLRKSAKEGDEVIVTGRIGGRIDPIMSDRAIVLIAERSLPTCSEGSPMEGCKTPWDYCCNDQKQVAGNLATIQVVDAGGKPLKAKLEGADKQQHFKPLAEIIVKGKVAKKDDSTLIINATGIYVKG